MSTHRHKLDQARPEYAAFFICCDTRTPGQTCGICGKGPDDQPISPNRALASNA